MNSSSLSLPGIVLAAFAFAAVATALARKIGLGLGISARRAVESGSDEWIPVFGGAPILTGLLLSLAIFSALPGWVLFAAIALWLCGLLGDAFELRSRQMLVAQAFITVLTVAAIPRFAFTPWPLLDFALAGCWLLTIINAFNLIDGLDGLLAGTGIIAALALTATGLLHHDASLAAIALATAGALAGFMIFNFPPASIFIGEAGALPIGMLLGIVSLRGGLLAHNSHLTRYVFPNLVMLMPLLDTAIVSVTRLATGASVLRRGLDRLHHRLLALGLSGLSTVALVWSIAIAGAVCALAASLLPHPYLLTSLPFTMLGAAIIALFMIDLTFDSNPPGSAYRRSEGIARFILNLGYKRRVAEALVDGALISAAYLGANLLRRNFVISDAAVTMLTYGLGWVILATYPAFLLAGVYRGIWRYTGLSDGIRFANAALLAGVFLIAASMLFPIYLTSSILVLYVILLFNLLVLTRSSFQTIRRAVSYLAESTQRVLIVGAGGTGTAAANYIFAERRHGVRLIGFIDDDAFKQGKLVHGQRVLGTCSELDRIFEASPFDLLMLADDDLSHAHVEQIREFAAGRRIAVHRFQVALSELRDRPFTPEFRAPGPAAVLQRTVP